MDIIRIQIAMCHSSEYSIHTENISGWPTALLHTIQPNPCTLLQLSIGAAQQYTVLYLLAQSWTEPIHYNHLHGIKIISQADSTCCSSKNATFLYGTLTDYDLVCRVVVGLLSQVSKSCRYVIEAGNIQLYNVFNE